MIDKKKISEAASYHLYDVRAAYADQEIGSYAYPTDIRDIEQQVRDDFEAGANWALQEFKKSLWHDASEEPEARVDIIGKSENFSHVFHFEYDDDWKMIFKSFDIECWCYIDDILPKEGGEQ